MNEKARDESTEGTLIELFSAVAQQTHADERLGEIGEPPGEELRSSLDAPSWRSDRDGAATKAMLTAAAVVLVLLVFGIVVVGRQSDDGRVTTLGSTVVPPGDPVLDTLPRIAPGWLPEGAALDAVDLHPGPPAKVGWRKVWTKPRTDGSARVFWPMTLVISPPELADREQPLIHNDAASPPVDINGVEGHVIYSFEALAAADGQKGHSVVWTVPSGVRVGLTIYGTTQDEAVALARSVQLDESAAATPSASIPSSAVPSGYVEAYAGPNYGAELSVNRINDPFGFVLLSYKDTRPPVGGREVAPAITLTVVPTPPGLDADAWLRAQLRDVQSGSIARFVVTPPAGGPATTTVPTPQGKGGDATYVTGAGDGFVFSIFGVDLGFNDAANIASRLRVLPPAEWADLLRSAASKPYPPRVVTSSSAALCDAMSAASNRHLEQRRSGPHDRPPPEASGADIRAIAAVAPPDVRDAFEPIAEYADIRAAEIASNQNGPPSTPWRPRYDVPKLNSAARQIDTWSQANCTEAIQVSQLGVTMMPYTAQDPNYARFCEAWQKLSWDAQPQVGFDAAGLPNAPKSLRSLVPALDAARVLLPAEATDIAAGIDHRRTLWLATEDGHFPTTGPQDPDGYLVGVVSPHCPDWPT